MRNISRSLFGSVFLGVSLLVTPLVLAAEQNNEQFISKAEERSAVKGAATFFTGDVSVTPLFAPKPGVADFSGGRVTFQPGSRSFWHTHPTGQHLLVLEGVGRTGLWNGSVEEIKAGDVLWCPPGVKHWHGASPDQAMSHIAITGSKGDGTNVIWMEQVTDEQYNK